MSARSFTKIWLHLICETQKREKSLIDKGLRKELSKHLIRYSAEKGIFMRINYVNPEHVHALIDLPTNMSIEEGMHLIKGESSFWVNKQVSFKFSWGKGYGAFSVSESIIEKVVNYIKTQEEHHRKISFTEEYESFLSAYNLWDK